MSGLTSLLMLCTPRQEQCSRASCPTPPSLPLDLWTCSRASPNTPRDYRSPPLLQLGTPPHREILKLLGQRILCERALGPGLEGGNARLSLETGGSEAARTHSTIALVPVAREGRNNHFWLGLARCLWCCPVASPDPGKGTPNRGLFVGEIVSTPRKPGH